MGNIVKFETISQYNDFNNAETLHPLISVIDFSKAHERSWGGQKSVKIYYGFYCIFLKDIKCGDLLYGCNYYDYQEGTLVFTAPGQVMEIETTGEVYQPKGYAL
ncbi:MAG TPA: AraC family transcriptional regulator, partial [Flavobacterium sp.]|nr:AraC family transcriptional regulator [Flavobacterium sp.]